MSKIIDAEDILADARSCVECIFLAASGLGGGLKHDATDPIQVVADGPQPAAAGAKPKSPAARTKRKSK